MATDRMQTGRGIKPVVENPRLPLMTDEPPPEKLIGGKRLLMPTKPKADAGKTKRMAAVVKGTVRQPKIHPEMEPRKTRSTAGRREGYVRLRLRVTDAGRMQVIGAKAVDGPLVDPKLQGAMAYEVTLEGRRLAAGGIPDVAEWRSFPDPNAMLPETEGHHVTEVPTYEVNVRVPKAEVSAADLPQLEIALFRVKEELPDAAPALAGDRPMSERFERELRVVGRLKGIKPDKLAKPLADQIKDAFK
jgi:hypothetical protein